VNLAVADTPEVMESQIEATGLAHSIAVAGLQVSQAADELRDAAERLMQAEGRAREAELRAVTAEQQLEQGATKNAELLEMLRVAKQGQAEADERSRRAQERVAAAETKLQETEVEADQRVAAAETDLLEAATQAKLAEERLELIAAQNAELLALVEQGQESQADGAEEARRTEERLRAEIERSELLERQLREMEERLRAEDRHLTVIVNDEERSALHEAVAAEVRRPLTSILGLALALKHADASSPDGKDMVKQLATNARKLDRLVGQMLDLDKIASGTFAPKRRRTDLGAMVRRVIEESQDMAKRDVRVDAKHVAIPVDPQLTEQMIDALLANAGRRTAPGNPVWVRITPERGGVVIAVDDTGPEVPPDLRSAMFAALAEEGSASRQKPRGATGLSLLTRLAEMHGGRAWVEERPGGGASFRVLLSDSAEGLAGDEGQERAVALAEVEASEPSPDEAPAADRGNGHEGPGVPDIGELPDIEALRELLTS